MSQPVPPEVTDPPPTGISGGAGEPKDHSRRDFLIASSVAATTVVVPLPSMAMEQNELAQRAKSVPVSISLTVNGQPRSIEIDSRQSLLDVLRESLELTGTKKGCNQGACGACTVIVNDRRVVSCLAMAALYDGASVTTIEGLASGSELHPLQAAFIEHEGFQCGYCTAGQIMSGVCCIKEGHAGSPRDVQYWMSGNICRCGAYPGITAAIVETARRERA